MEGLMELDPKSVSLLEDAIDGKVSKGQASTPTSYMAEVLDIDEHGIVWVHVFGGAERTPAMRVLSTVSKGDTVRVTLENGMCTIIGNDTDKAAGASSVRKVSGTVAKIQNRVTKVENLKADRVQVAKLQADVAEIDELVAAKANVSDLEATNANVQNLQATKANVSDLNAATARIGNLEADHVKVSDLEATNANVENLQASKADVSDLTAAKARIANLESDHVTVSEFRAEQGYIDDLQAATADLGTIRANSAKVQNLTAAQLEADHAKVGQLDSTYATIDSLNAEKARIDDLDANKADISTLEAEYAHISNGVIDNAKIGYADVNGLSANYAEIDLANVDNAWIDNGVIANGAISDAMINDVSANKLTAGEIDASRITVSNLNAKNIKVEKINGQTVTGKSIADALSQHESDISDVSDDVTALDGKVDDAIDDLNGRIDAQIQTWTSTAVPTLDNYPASGWTTDKLKDEHVGDILYVVNTASQADGYTYRFCYDGTGDEYFWTLIKDNQVTDALQRLITAEGNIDGLQDFQSSTETWMSETDEGLTTIRTNHTTLSSRVDKTITSSVQLWFSKANTTAPAKPTAHITSTSTGGNAWTTVVPAWNASYPNYYYCYEWKYADGTYGWSSVTRDIAMGESQQQARKGVSDAATADGKAVAAQSTADTAKATADANIKSSVQLWFTKANSTAPEKPTSAVSVNDASKGNQWNLAVPTYNATYPHYFYCYQQQKGDGTYQWTDVVYDRATSENQANARSALSQVATKVETSTFNTLKNTVDGNSATITTLTTRTDTLANPNLTPYLSKPVTDSSFWRSADGRGDPDPTSEGVDQVNNLDDGWGHVIIDARASAGNQNKINYMNLHVEKGGLRPYVKPGGKYTWLIEVRNLEFVVEAEGVTPAMYARPSIGHSTLDLLSDTGSIAFTSDGAEYKTVTAKADFSTLTRDTRGYFFVNPGYRAEFDLRVSLYEGEYSGPYKPFINATSQETVSNTVNTVQQTADSNSAKITQLVTTVGANADGTNPGSSSIISRTSAIEQDLSGFKSTVSSTYATKTEFVALSIGGRNLALKTGTPVTCVRSGTHTYMKPSNVFKTSAYGLSQLANTGNERFTVSFDWEATNVTTAFSLLVSLRNTEDAYSQGTTVVVSGNRVAAGDSSGHYVKVFEPTDGHRQYGGGWLFGGMSTGETEDGTLVFSNFKFEKGNRATDWTPAPEDLESRVTQAETAIEQNADAIELRATKAEFNALSIGGRNYSRESAVLDNTTYWVRDKVTSVAGGQTDPYGGTDAYLITPSATNWWLTNKARLIEEVGETYTASIWLRADAETSCNICVRYLDSEYADSSHTTRMTVTVTTEWTRFSVTGVLSKSQAISNTDLMWFGQKSTKPIYAYRPKVEKGNRATDWTPAPEDVATAAELKVANDEISARVEKDGVIAAINASVEEEGGSAVKIQADKVNIEGAAIFTGSGRLSQASLSNAYDAKGAASAAQAAAISAAASDAATKAAAAEASAKAYTDAVEVGGRNLALESRGEYSVTKTGDDARTLAHKRLSDYGVEVCTVGNTLLFSFEAKVSSGNHYVRPYLRDSVNYQHEAPPAAIATTEWQHFVYKIALTGNAIYWRVTANTQTDSTGVTYFLRNVKVETGNKPTDWTPAPEDTDAAIDTAVKSVAQNWFATCSTAAATAAKVATITPTTGDFQLKAGVTVNVKFGNSNSHSATSDDPVTLDVNGTGAKNIFYANSATPTGTNTTAFGRANYTNTYVYDGTYWVWVSSSADNNTTYNLGQNQHSSAIKAAAAITKAHIICGTSSGYKMLAASVEFDLSYPLLYATADIASGGTATSTYLTYPNIAFSTSGTITAGGANKAIYLKGTVTGNTFKLSAAPFLTCTPATYADGFFYIPLGTMTSSTAGYFNSSKDLYACIDTRFRQVTPSEVVASQLIYISKASGTASVDANTTWVTSPGDNQNSWTTKRPTYSTDYPVLFVATQQKRLDGIVTCTTPVKDDTTTVIDGGHITTGTIDASKATITNIDASNITTGTLSAERIAAGSLAIGKVDGLQSALDDKVSTSEFIVSRDSIRSNVSALSSSSESTSSQLSELIDALDQSSSFEQTSDGFVFSIDRILDEGFGNIETYLKMTDDGLVLGRSDSDINSVLTNTRFSFRTDNGDIAYFGKNDDGAWEMHIANTFADDMLRFGDFAWIKRANGNMTLKWLGS